MAGFPRRRLARGALLYWIHRVERDPWWFSSERRGRFDLTGERGTCYMAEDPLGAFIEVFRDDRGVNRKAVEAHALSALPLPRGVALADCTSRRARAFGVTAAIHSSEDYARTHAWAEAFARAGFDGVRYLVSHDPGQRLTGVALFGRAQRWRVARTESIPREVVVRAERAFGIRVLPTP